MTNHKFIVRFLVLLLFFCGISCHQTMYASESAEAKKPALHPLTGRPLSSDFLWDPMSVSFDTLDPVLTHADLLFQIPGQNGFHYYAVWGESPSLPSDSRLAEANSAAATFALSLHVPYAQDVGQTLSYSLLPRFSFDLTAGYLKEEGALLPMEENAPIFIYDSKSMTYRQENMPGFSWTNVFLLEVDITCSMDGTIQFPVDGGTGFYLSHGAYEEIRWQTYPDENRFALRDENSEPLMLFPGNSFFMLIPYSLYG